MHDKKPIQTQSRKTKPWQDAYGVMLDDEALKVASKQWPRKTWEEYLQLHEKPQKELLLQSYERVLHKHDAKVVKEISSIDSDIAAKESEAFEHIPLRVLTFQQRRAIKAIFYQGLSRKEVGAALGIAPVTVRANLKRAMKRLRKAMKDRSVSSVENSGELK